jgi:multicomponent Na+:H+ antiporter subunit E
MKLLRLLFRYAIDFVQANLTIARQVLSPRLEIEPEIIEIDTRVKSPLEVLALSNLITFTPGTLTLEIDPEKEKLVVHVLDDAEVQATAIREGLEKPLLEITRKGPNS